MKDISLLSGTQRIYFELNYAKWIIDTFDFKEKELAKFILNKTISDITYKAPPWWKLFTRRYKKWNWGDLYETAGNLQGIAAQVYWVCGNCYVGGYILSVKSYYDFASRGDQLKLDDIADLAFADKLSISPYAETPDYSNFFSSL